jgi:hypothetical protein
MEQNNPTAMQGIQPLALDIVRTPSGYACDGRHADGQASHYAFPASLYGVTLTPEIVTSLVEHGTTGIMELEEAKGRRSLGRIVLRDSHLAAETDLRILQGSCPVCGGRIVKTSKGYFCEHALGQDGQCDFHALSYLAHRDITEQEMEDFLLGHPQILNGFSTYGKRIFCGYLTLNAEHTLSVCSYAGRCPVCGGKLLIGLDSFTCENSHDTAHPCKTTAWRRLRGHNITLQEMEEITRYGHTLQPVELFAANGGRCSRVIGWDSKFSGIHKIENDE